MRLPCFARPVAATLLALALLPAGGCFALGSGSADASEGELDDELEPEEGIEDPHSRRVISTDPLAACTEGLSPREIEDAVAITFDFEVSAHEMIACGGLVFGIVGALVEGIAELAENPGSSTLPEGFSLDEGTYSIEPGTFNDLRMEVRFYLGRDYSFGSKGELVTENLFLMSSYLRNAKAEVHLGTDSNGWPTYEIEITHDGPGPLVELLGLGAEPPSPIRVGQSELLAAQAHLGDLEVEATIFFVDHPGVSTIEYDVEAGRMLARSFLERTPMDLAMVGADGWRVDLEQDLDVDQWAVEYADSGVGALDGDIDFTVRGGPFDFVSSFHYDRSGWPTVELACAPQ